MGHKGEMVLVFKELKPNVESRQMVSSMTEETWALWKEE